MQFQLPPDGSEEDHHIHFLRKEYLHKDHEVKRWSAQKTYLQRADLDTEEELEQDEETRTRTGRR